MFLLQMFAQLCTGFTLNTLLVVIYIVLYIKILQILLSVFVGIQTTNWQQTTSWQPVFYESRCHQAYCQHISCLGQRHRVVVGDRVIQSQSLSDSGLLRCCYVVLVVSVYVAFFTSQEEHVELLKYGFQRKEIHYKKSSIFQS